MNPPRLAVLTLLLVLAALPVRSQAASIERELTLGTDRIQLDRSGEVTHVAVRGGIRETAPGRPDVPWLSEAFDVPYGFRVTAVRVTAIETSTLAEGAMLPSAIEGRPGLGPILRTAPDPEFFARPGFQPEAAARLGYQGWMRGRNVAYVEWSPVRWEPTSGRLERVERLRVRLELEPGRDEPLRRERIVPEWERGPIDAALMRGARVTRESERDATPRAQPFKATQIPSVLGSPVQYVIITDDAMAGEFQRLADWKTQSGVPAVVRTLSFIQQQYVGGSDDAERIRMFIRDAYARWGTKWVLLGGDTEILPTRLARTNYYGGEDIACDMYFSCLDGNWNADGDHLYGEGKVGTTGGDFVDLLPEVWVGRAPAVDVAEAQRFVDKTLQYTRQPAGDYENRLLFFAEVLFPQNWIPGSPTDLDGAALVEDCLPPLQANPQIHFARLYENWTEPSWVPGALPESRAAVIDSLGDGYNIACHVGHGYRNVMSVADANLTNEDALGLTNGNRLINLYASNCTSNAIDFPSIGEAFLHAPNGGAVTNIGSSRFDFPVAGRYVQEEYFRLVYEDSVSAVGEAQGLQKMVLVPSALIDNMNRWTIFTLLLLGDPELRVYTGLPRTLTVTHPATLALSDTTLAVHVEIGGVPLAGARVTAYKAGDEYRTGLTDSAGDIVLPYRPESLGAVTLTVTGYDCRPYQATVNLTAATGPVLADLAPAYEDDNFDGTLGDGDGEPDAGETVDVTIPLQNRGTSSASTIVATLSTTDSMVSVTAPTLAYGTIGVNAIASPAATFRISIPITVPDQHEVPFRLSWTGGGGYYGHEDLQVVIKAPEIQQFRHVVQDAGGNSDGRVDPGETITLLPELKNMGTGQAHGVTVKLRNHDGLAVVSDSTSSYGEFEPGEEITGDPLVFVAVSTTAKLELRVSSSFGLLYTRLLDLVAPAPATNVSGSGQETSVSVTWTKSASTDVLGYDVFRSLAPGGPFTRVNVIPNDRTAYYRDSGLSPLTQYYYQVTAIDSSGNESDPSAVFAVSTTPPNHTIFPIPMGRSTPSSVAVDALYPGYPLDIVVGADVLYCWHPDGTAPVDADGAGATSGDFTTRGSYYAAGPSIADLDGDGVKEVIGVNWNPADTARAFVFDLAGQAKPGWPVTVNDSIWSSAAIGDVDRDGKKEMFFGTFGRQFYGFRFDGSEVVDGDSNPGTVGVFKQLDADFNLGTPALADLDRDGYLDIVYVGFEGKLLAWRHDGATLAGFPKQVPGLVTSSVAVGPLDGPDDDELDIVFATGSLTNNGTTDSLHVFRANGERKPGWPKKLIASGVSRAPSAAIGDVDQDGALDVVFAGTDGLLHVYDGDGVPVAPLHGVRYSAMTFAASESSPVIADINGDGWNDVVMGDDLGMLTAISGATGTILPGFPIQLTAEVKGGPAVCDCDGDGMTEIVVACWDRNLYMWDYDFPFSPGQTPPWPQYHHDAMRTGLATNPAFVALDVTPAARPTAIEFAAPAPNPAQGKMRISYAVPDERAGSTVELAVYDLSGRRVRMLASGPARPGRHFAEWNLRDAAGQPVGAGVYFLKLNVGAESRSQKLVVLH